MSEDDLECAIITFLTGVIQEGSVIPPHLRSVHQCTPETRIEFSPAVSYGKIKIQNKFYRHA